MGGNGWTGISDESLKIPDRVFVTVGDVLTVQSILASEVCVLDVLHATSKWNDYIDQDHSITSRPGLW